MRTQIEKQIATLVKQLNRSAFALLIGGLFVGALSQASAPCLNLSGNFSAQISEDQNTTLRVIQTGCDSMSMDFDYFHRFFVTRNYTFDGTLRFVFRSAEEELQESSLIDSTGANVTGLDEYKIQKQKFINKVRYFLDEQKNLVEASEVFTENGSLLKSEKNIYFRQANP